MKGLSKRTLDNCLFCRGSCGGERECDWTEPLLISSLCFSESRESSSRTLKCWARLFMTSCEVYLVRLSLCLLWEPQSMYRPLIIMELKLLLLSNSVFFSIYCVRFFTYV